MAEAIIFGYDPGATLYVRFVTSRTTSVFAALTEGTGSGASFYFVTEAALVSAGLNAAGTWSGKIFVGTPSGSANDVNIGTVTLPWTGSAVGGGGTSQPRVNKPAGEAFTLQVSTRGDGTYKATRPGGGPVRIRATEAPAIEIEMTKLYGATFVSGVGTPTASPTGELTATALGPRDESAMIQLGGSPVAGITYTVSAPVTMDTGGSGETISVSFDVVVFAN